MKIFFAPNLKISVKVVWNENFFCA